MRVGRAALEAILKGNVAEITFLRRTPGPSDIRRMLCTLDMRLLNSNEGRVALNFRPAQHPAPYNPKAYNLLVVWDIFMQDYRAISMDNCQLVQAIKSTPPDDFWAFFNNTLSKMTPEQKIRFMQNIK
jgi:hypothetical protein